MSLQRREEYMDYYQKARTEYGLLPEGTYGFVKGGGG